MDAATTIRRAREQAALSKRELARRAGTSHAAVVAYESGRRDPTVTTLSRLLAAAGVRAELVTEPRAGVDAERAGRILEQVLDLADVLPHRPARRRLEAPVLGR